MRRGLVRRVQVKVATQSAIQVHVDHMVGGEVTA